MRRIQDPTGTRGRFACLLLTAACLAGLVSPAHGQAIRGEDATEADGARFQNDRARQHMLELEQRMFRLADMLKASQPEDAQRLIMGVERSREQLLVQRMSSVSELIGELELNEASQKVDTVIGELQAIKKLLLTADLELAIKMEQLRKIKAAIKDLEAIEAQEAENQGQSDKLAEDGNPSAQAMKGLGDAEDRNKEATDRLGDKVGDINPQDPNLAQAQKALGEASGKMGEASGELSQSQSPSGASQSQGEARKKLDQAKKDLEAARDELQKEVERKIREQVVENLRAMLKQQTEIREQLELVSERADRGDSRALVQVRGFAEPEEEIVVLAGDTIDLCELTDFSVAMPAALSAVRDRMVFLVDDYAAGRGGPTVVAATIRVEKDLEALIDAMELSNQNQEPKEPNPNQNPREQEQREINQILAELRMLRIMQIATNDNVIRIEQLRKSGDLPESTLRQREMEVRDQQERVREATEKLREMAMKGG